jgi:hypothetical protein
MVVRALSPSVDHSPYALLIDLHVRARYLVSALNVRQPCRSLIVVSGGVLLCGIRPVRDESPEPTRARAAHVAGLLSDGPTEREEVPTD